MSKRNFTWPDHWISIKWSGRLMIFLIKLMVFFTILVVSNDNPKIHFLEFFHKKLWTILCANMMTSVVWNFDHELEVSFPYIYERFLTFIWLEKKLFDFSIELEKPNKEKLLTFSLNPYNIKQTEHTFSVMNYREWSCTFNGRSRYAVSTDFV